MPMWRSAGKPGGSLPSGLGEGVAGVGDGRAREVGRVPVGVVHHLHDVRVEEGLGGRDRVHGRRDRCLGPQGQLPRHRADEARVDEGLVALHVHHDLVLAEAEQVDGLGEAVGARGMRGRGGADAPAERRHRVRDLGVVGRDHHLLGAALRGPLGDPGDHGLAGDVGEHLARQARRAQARRDDDLEGEGLHRRGAPQRFFFGAELPRLFLEHDGDVVAHREGEPVGAADELVRPRGGGPGGPCRSGRRGFRGAWDPSGAFPGGEAIEEEGVEFRRQRRLDAKEPHPRIRECRAFYGILLRHDDDFRPGQAQLRGLEMVVVGKRMALRARRPAAPRCAKNRAGLPMPATAATRRPRAASANSAGASSWPEKETKRSPREGHRELARRRNDVGSIGLALCSAVRRRHGHDWNANGLGWEQDGDDIENSSPGVVPSSPSCFSRGRS